MDSGCAGKPAVDLGESPLGEFLFGLIILPLITVGCVVAAVILFGNAGALALPIVLIGASILAVRWFRTDQALTVGMGCGVVVGAGLVLLIFNI